MAGDELQKYITGIVTTQKHKLIAINNMSDRLHALIGMRPDATLSNLVGDIKTSSYKLINGKRLEPRTKMVNKDG